LELFNTENYEILACFLILYNILFFTSYILVLTLSISYEKVIKNNCLIEAVENNCHFTETII